MIRMTMSGGDQIKGNLRRFLHNWSNAKRRALRAVMGRVLELSREMVPYDEGNLWKSGKVVESDTGRSISVTYGGPDVPYAIAVHEHLSNHSPRSWRTCEARGGHVHFYKPGTGPKYLELALSMYAMEYAKILQEELSMRRVGL